MRQLLVYSDSLSWGIIPGTRERLRFDQRWPGVLENGLLLSSLAVRVIEDCLNGRRAGNADPVKAGRNAQLNIEQVIEAHSPVELVLLMLGNNDFQAMHSDLAPEVAEHIKSLVQRIRSAPIEPGMPTPDILVIAPPDFGVPSGTMAEKFAGAADKAVGLDDCLAKMCEANNVHFFSTRKLIRVSNVDGVHLDADAHFKLGIELSEYVTGLLEQHFLDRHWQ